MTRLLLVPSGCRCSSALSVLSPADDRCAAPLRSSGLRLLFYSLALVGPASFFGPLSAQCFYLLVLLLRRPSDHRLEGGRSVKIDLSLGVLRALCVLFFFSFSFCLRLGGLWGWQECNVQWGAAGGPAKATWNSSFRGCSLSTVLLSLPPSRPRVSLRG